MTGTSHAHRTDVGTTAMKEDWKTPLGVIFIFLAFLIATIVLMLPALSKFQTNTLIVAAILVATGVGFIGLQRWRK